MTTSTDRINFNIENTEFFVEFSASFSKGTSVYDKISSQAKQNQRFMNFLISSGIAEKENRPNDDYKYHYSLKASGGHASLKGKDFNSGNPGIVVEEIKHQIQGVRSNNFPWSTDYTKLDWDRVWQVIRLQNSGVLINIDQVKEYEYLQKHVIRGSQARNYWYMYGLLDGEYTLFEDYEKGVQLTTKGKFNIQQKLFSDRPTKFRFTDLLKYEESLRDQNIILDHSEQSDDYKDNLPKISMFVYVPKSIYNHCLQDLINNNKEGQNAVLYSYLINDKYNAEFLRGLGILGSNTFGVEAETLARQFKINNIMVVCSNNPEEWQMYEQNPAKTILNKKTHKIIISLKEAFKYGNPKSDQWHEFHKNESRGAESKRAIMVTPFYDIELQIRKRDAVSSNTIYGDTIFAIHGKQELIPTNLDYAGAFEIDSAKTLGVTQAEFETTMSSVDNPAKIAYSSIFYAPDQNDGTLPWLKPIV